MTQYRVHFTETTHGYIVCDSKDEAQETQQALNDGDPIDELAHRDDIVITDDERTATIKS